MKKIYDVIIVGAGPAGSFSAYEMAKIKVKGRPVDILILEASKTLKRGKPCGGAIYKETIEQIPELKKILVGHSSAHAIYIDNKKTMDKKSDQYFLLRTTPSSKTLDYFLPKLLSKKKNIILKLGQRVNNIKLNKEYAEVQCQDDAYLGRVIIDASGIGSKFNEKLVGGKSLDERNKYLCAIAEFRLNKENKKKILDLIENNAHKTRLDFFEGEPLNCYWIFYYGKIDFVNIGCGFLYRKGERYIDAREKLINYLNLQNIRGWKLENIRSWIDPIEMPKKLCTNHILWIGDSAGMSNPFSGHGVPYAAKCAKALAEACAAALEKGDFSEKMLRAYQNHPLVMELMAKSRIKNRMINYFHKHRKIKFPLWFRKMVLKR